MDDKKSGNQMSVHGGCRKSEPSGSMPALKGKNVGDGATRKEVAPNPKPLGGRNA